MPRYEAAGDLGRQRRRRVVSRTTRASGPPGPGSQHRRAAAAVQVTVRGSDGVQHLSAVHQRVSRLQQVGETVELLEPGAGVTLIVRGMTGNRDRDGVLDHVLTVVGAEREPGDPGAEERARPGGDCPRAGSDGGRPVRRRHPSRAKGHGIIVPGRGLIPAHLASWTSPPPDDADPNSSQEHEA